MRENRSGRRLTVLGFCFLKNLYNNMGRSPNRKLTFEKRQEILAKVSDKTELISEFKHPETGKYWCTFKCQCGKLSSKSWNDLQSGEVLCKDCSPNKTLTFEERIEMLKERNPEVILLSVKRDEKRGRYNCEFKTTFDDTIKVREWTNLIAKHKVLKNPAIKKEESFEIKKRYLEENNSDFELIDTFVKGKKNVRYYHYKCRCGNIATGKWPQILSGKNCVECKETNLYTIEEKQNILNDIGINSKIISQFVDNSGRSVCRYTCSNCGKEYEKLWDYIRLSGLCDDCNPRKKYKLEDRQKIIDEINPGVLILEEFKKNGDWWMKYKCTCGEIAEKTWDHLREGAKCMSCSGLRRYTIEERQEIIKKNNPNIILLNDFIGSNGDTYCNYICTCGKQKISTYQHLRLGGTCSECGSKKIQEKLSFTLEQVKEKLLSVNKNIKIIDNTYLNSRTKLKCLCLKCKKEFNLDWNSINQGTGCPSCSSSKGEKRIEKFLGENNIYYLHQKCFDDLFGLSGYRKLIYDFYLPDYNLLIEYDGRFHYEMINISSDEEKTKRNFERQQKHDTMKNEYAKDNNINLLRISFLEYNDIEHILIDNLKL